MLVNNAGIMLVAPLDAMVKGDFEEAMQIHFWAPYHITMAALPYLRRNGESGAALQRRTPASLSNLGQNCILRAIEMDQHRNNNEFQRSKENS